MAGPKGVCTGEHWGNWGPDSIASDETGRAAGGAVLSQWKTRGRGHHVFIFWTLLNLCQPSEDSKSAAVFLGQELGGGVWAVSHLT